MDKKIELNEKLDKCICLYIECYENIITQKELLNKCLDDGYLNLSKARSIMGCSNLSILQVPSEELKAKVMIETKNENTCVKTDEPNVDFEYDVTNFDLKIQNDDNNESSSVQLPNWFGVLTPLSLKTSQKSFCRSLNLITSICECQIKLKTLERIYKELLLEKNKLSN